MELNDSLKKNFLSNTSDIIIGSKKKGALPPMDTKPTAENILNSILPPREWVEDGRHYI